MTRRWSPVAAAGGSNVSETRWSYDAAGAAGAGDVSALSLTGGSGRFEGTGSSTIGSAISQSTMGSTVSGGSVAEADGNLGNTRTVDLLDTALLQAVCGRGHDSRGVDIGSGIGGGVESGSGRDRNGDGGNCGRYQRDPDRLNKGLTVRVFRAAANTDVMAHSVHERSTFIANNLTAGTHAPAAHATVQQVQQVQHQDTMTHAMARPPNDPGRARVIPSSSRMAADASILELFRPPGQPPRQPHLAGNYASGASGFGGGEGYLTLGGAGNGGNDTNKEKSLRAMISACPASDADSSGLPRAKAIRQGRGAAIRHAGSSMVLRAAYAASIM